MSDFNSHLFQTSDVTERRAGNCSTLEFYRLKDSNRSECSVADLPFNVFQNRFFENLSRLEGDVGLRTFVCSHIVHIYGVLLPNNAVNVIFKIIKIVKDFFQVVHSCLTSKILEKAVFRNLKSVAFKERNQILLSTKFFIRRKVLSVIANHIQMFTTRTIQVLHNTTSTITAVLKFREILLLIFAREQHFATNVASIVVLQLQRNEVHFLHIFCNVIPSVTITTGRSLNQNTILVSQTDRVAIHLEGAKHHRIVNSADPTIHFRFCICF